MGAPSSDVRNSIATRLLNWGFANFELYENPAEILIPIKTTGGIENLCQIKSDDFAIIVKKGEGSKIEKKYILPDKVAAPIKSGNEIGHIEYYANGKSIGKSPIISTVNIEKIDFWTLFVRILSRFIVK